MITPNPHSTIQLGVNQGQTFLRQTGLYLLLGLSITGIISYVLFHNPISMAYFFNFNHGKQSLTGLGWLVLFLPIILTFLMSFMLNTASKGLLFLFYILITSSFGITLSTLGFSYNPQIIFMALMATIASFSGFALWGFFTSKNLGGLGHFIFMALWGLIIMGFIQIFWHNSLFNFVLGVGGVLIFTLLTAYDIQKLKEISQSQNIDNQRISIWFALSLYLDFINIFVSLLRILGSGKR